MTRKQMPMILMLAAGGATALITYFRGYSLKTMLIALLATLVAFYMIGCIIKMVLDSFEKANEKTVSDEGEVIEKEGEPSETQKENDEDAPKGE